MNEEDIPRTQKRASKKKRIRLKITVAILILLIVVFVILGAVVKVSPIDTAWEKTVDAFQWLGRKISSLWSNDGNGAPPVSDIMPDGKEAANILIGVTKEVDNYSMMTTLILFSYDSRDGTASFIFFPNDLLVDVPGSGLEQLINLIEQDEDRFDMTRIAIENLVGVEVDRYVLALDRDVKIILDQIAETYPVNVTENLAWNDTSLETKITLDPGQQNLSGAELASYLTYSEMGSELDLIERQIGFTPTFMEKSKERLGEKKDLAKKNANLLDTDASGDEIWGFWAELARMDPDKLTLVTMPTEEFRFESTAVHRVNNEKLPDFIKKYVNSDPKVDEAKRVRLELLNGCGVPAVGFEVASDLDLTKFKIVNSANADNFEHPESVIIVYGDQTDRELVSAAESVRNALEVGRIEFHDTESGVADITAIVGKDYANK